MAIIASGTVGQLGAAWILDDLGVLTVSAGTIDWTEEKSPWEEWKGEIQTINFPSAAGAIVAGPSLKNLFFNLKNVTAVNNLSSFTTSSVTDMSGLFSGLAVLETLDLTNWNTSNVTDMSEMFKGMRNLETLALGPSWQTGNVRDLSGLFSFCCTLNWLLLNVSNWNTANVEDMSSMFEFTKSLTQLNLSAWNTSNVRRMSGMFFGASSLTILNVANWNTANVIEMGFMFENTPSLGGLDLSGWDTRWIEDPLEVDTYLKRVHMDDMFDPYLWNLKLGPNFSFRTSCTDRILPPISIYHRGTSIPEYTGDWRNMGNGTIGAPNGTANRWTSEQLMSSYGPTMAETYIKVKLTTQITTFMVRPEGQGSNSTTTIYHGTAAPPAGQSLGMPTITITVNATYLIGGSYVGTLMAVSPTPINIWSGRTSKAVTANGAISFQNGDLAHANNGQVYTLKINAI